VTVTGVPKQAARDLDCDEDEGHWDERLREVVGPQARPGQADRALAVEMARNDPLRTFSGKPEAPKRPYSHGLAPPKFE
jgi:hypothetical protein